MKRSTLLGLFFVIFFNYSFAQPGGYGFGKQILIQSSQVVGGVNLTNFPMLVSFTDPDLRTIANGGNVSNANGFDIIFTLGDCSTILSHQIESYNPVTGRYVAWVRIPTLSASTNTGIHMYYGNSGVVANPSTTTTWSAGYDGVWHLSNNSFADGTATGNNGTNNGSTNLSPGKIADARNFVDPNHWIELPNHPNRTTSFTYSGWFRTNDNTRPGQRIICDDATNANGCHAISLGDPGTGQLRFYIRGLSVVSHDSPNLVANNTWYHVAASYNSTTGAKVLYLNGAVVSSGTVTGTMGTPTGNASIGGEVAAGENTNRFHGDLDEMRSFPGVLTAGWIGTEYNNQNNPAAFYAVSAQMTAAILCATLPIELIDFTAVPSQKTVDLNWATASELDNDYFIVERSRDGNTWLSLVKIDGAGNSSSRLNYFYQDKSPLLGFSYYRLKQVDFNGQYSYSYTRNVDFVAAKDVVVYPNPAEDYVIVEKGNTGIEGALLYNLLGQNVTPQIIFTEQTETSLKINVSQLPAGIYFIVAESITYKFYKK